MPRAGIIRNLGIRHTTVNGNGNTVVYAVLVNGVLSGLSVTLATGAIGQAFDLVNTAVVAAGARLSLRAVKALTIGNNVAVQASLEFTPR